MCDVFIMLYLIVLIIKHRMGCDILRKLKSNNAKILKETQAFSTNEVMLISYSWNNKILLMSLAYNY